jgi:hypothetical protein|tara:strand:+ start:888 stop:1937 length:1050 start_codon:yes stop_codon:yes gene_type:complete
MKINEIFENMSYTGTALKKAERKKGIEPGTPEWFKHWFELPYMKEDVTPGQLNALERVIDKVFGRVGIDVAFTRHFIDRANDSRNGEPISIQELGKLFAKEYKQWGQPIADMGPDAQAVMKDLESDVNIPFVLEINPRTKMLDLVAKSVMRKKDFKTNNKVFPVENTTSLGSKINFPGFQNSTITPTPKTPPAPKNNVAKPARNRFDKIVNWGKSLFDEDEIAIEEDFGSMPSLVDIILIAVALKTTVAGVKLLFKTAQGVQKIRSAANSVGVKLADKLFTEDSKTDIMDKILANQKSRFWEAAIEALHRLSSSHANRQTLGGYAFDIARSFNGMDSKELLAAYYKKYQ